MAFNSLKSDVGERRMVLNRARSAVQISRLQLDRHERLRRCVVLTANVPSRSGNKAEAGIVRWMSENDHRAKTEPGALLETGAHKTRPYAFALMRRGHGHGSEAHDLQLRVLDEGNRREHDVPDDFVLVLGHQRHHRLRSLAQGVDQLSFRRRLERCRVDATNTRAISQCFRAY